MKSGDWMSCVYDCVWDVGNFVNFNWVGSVTKWEEGTMEDIL